MNVLRVGSIAIVLGCCVVQAEDNSSLKTRVKAKVTAMNNALMKGEFEKIADLTHPNVIKNMGGREKAIAAMQSGAKDMESRGIAIRSVKVDDPSDPVTAGSDLFVVVPFLMEMKTPKGKILGKSFVIGTSRDEGKSWVFVNGDIDIKTIKGFIPNLPEKLQIPEKQDPVFEKE